MATIILGSVSDSRGRKIALVAPVVGAIFRGVLAVVLVFRNREITLMWLGAGMEGFCGGGIVLTLAAFAYMADITNPANRTFRMVLICVAEALAMGVGEILAGYSI